MKCYPDNFYFNKHSVIEIQKYISVAENALMLQYRMKNILLILT